MRLNNSQIETIKNIITGEIGECDIYIFGSRLNDRIKGGDVDIFVNKTITQRQKQKIKNLLEEELFLPVDIVYHKDYERLIEKEALKGIKI